MSEKAIGKRPVSVGGSVESRLAAAHARHPDAGRPPPSYDALANAVDHMPGVLKARGTGLHTQLASDRPRQPLPSPLRAKVTAAAAKAREDAADPGRKAHEQTDSEKNKQEEEVQQIQLPKTVDYFRGMEFYKSFSQGDASNPPNSQAARFERVSSIISKFCESSDAFVAKDNRKVFC